MSTDPAYVKELQDQVRILGNRVVALDQELEQKRAYIDRVKSDDRTFNQIGNERDAAVKQGQRLKQELAAESKRRSDAERLVAALKSELETKARLLERYAAQDDLSEKLAALQPLLTTVLQATQSLSSES